MQENVRECFQIRKIWTFSSVDDSHYTVVELPTILNSLFCKVVNTTSTPLGVEDSGGGELQNGELFQFKNFTWPNGINSGCFQTHMSQNEAIYAQSRQPVMRWFPAGCLPVQQTAFWQPCKTALVHYLACVATGKNWRGVTAEFAMEH